jgi:hypothetical protein
VISVKKLTEDGWNKLLNYFSKLNGLKFKISNRWNVFDFSQNLLCNYSLIIFLIHKFKEFEILTHLKGNKLFFFFFFFLQIKCLLIYVPVFHNLVFLYNF